MVDASSGPASQVSMGEEAVRSWADARNLLCIRLDSLGDVLMTTPAIRALKEAKPERKITLLTSASGAAAARLASEIDEVIVYDAPWMKHSSAGDAGPLREYAMAEHLRKRAFDAAVIFTVYSQNPLPAAFLCYLADIPLRLAHCRENPYQLLTNWVKDVEPSHNVRHEVRRQLDLVATVGATTRDERLSVRVPAPAFEKVVGLLSAAGLDFNRPWLVLHPGATASSRRYPLEQYAEVIRQLLEEAGAQVVLTGTTSEIELIDQIRSQVQIVRKEPPAAAELALSPREAFDCLGPLPGLISLAGLLEVEEMAGLLQMAPLLISNNTGPVHIAAGLGTPTVVLYALTNPQHTPWLTPSKVLFQDVPCKFCYRSTCPLGHTNCLRLVPPQRVVKAALDFLRKRGWLLANVAASGAGAEDVTQQFAGAAAFLPQSGGPAYDDALSVGEPRMEAR